PLTGKLIPSRPRRSVGSFEKDTVLKQVRRGPRYRRTAIGVGWGVSSQGERYCGAGRRLESDGASSLASDRSARQKLWLLACGETAKMGGPTVPAFRAHEEEDGQLIVMIAINVHESILPIT